MLSEEPDRGRGSVRLFCFPHAGGGSAAFHAWRRSAPAWLAISAVLPPGRGEGPPARDLAAVADELAERLFPGLRGPFALYGHSLGALVAFELAHRLAERGAPAPLHLFASACGAPRAHADPPRRRPLHALDSARLREELRGFGGTPPALLDDPRVFAEVEPLLRHDLGLLEGYAPPPRAPLALPITAFGGREDRLVPARDLQRWSHETRGEFRCFLLDGGHFFTPAGSEWTRRRIERHLARRRARREDGTDGHDVDRAA